MGSVDFYVSYLIWEWSFWFVVVTTYLYSKEFSGFFILPGIGNPQLIHSRKKSKMLPVAKTFVRTATNFTLQLHMWSGVPLPLQGAVIWMISDQKRKERNLLWNWISLCYKRVTIAFYLQLFLRIVTCLFVSLSLSLFAVNQSVNMPL